VLRINNNQLQTLPDTLCTLSHLSQIFAQYNQLIKLPEQIGNLPLTDLFIHYNQINELPESFYNLTHLVRLNVAFAGPMFKFDDRICDLKKLEQLFIDQTSLTFSPRCLQIKNNSNSRFTIYIIN
jgi:Leucine-rich repeat (LRR) protein